MNHASVCAALLMAASAVLWPQTAQAQTLSYEQRYCLGMGGVAAGTIEMVQSGGRSWPQIENELVRTVRQAGWPLGQADYDKAVEIGLVGVRGGDDARTVAVFIINECLDYAWFSRAPWR